MLSVGEARAWRAAHAGAVAFTNGVFDLVHPGHVDVLVAARAEGDALVVGVNSDASVRRLKGSDRPVRNQGERAAVLAAFECVDVVVIFDEDTPLELVRALTPDVIVKGGDYARDTVVGADLDRAGRARRDRAGHSRPLHHRHHRPAAIPMTNPSPTPRRDGRAPGSPRIVTLERGASRYAEGSCLAAFGDTRVLCTVSVEDGVPSWKKGRAEGWLTAEYAMLPRATHTRSARERDRPQGRTQEIQRLIGRSVRAMIDGFAFGEYTLKVDCDVMQADGGTRTAAITGASVAVVDAFDWMVRTGRLAASPVRRRVAAISVGVIDGECRVDLDYAEDVRAAVDMNVVMSSEGRFVEVQGTGEHGTFGRGELDALLALAEDAIRSLDSAQREVLARAGAGA